MKRVIGMCLLAVAANAICVWAQSKDSYTLFAPTPPAQMREMTTDRPDKTEVPFTVDAGHVQMESDVISYVYDDEDDARTDAWAVMPSNFRIGVLNNTEFGIVVEPYLHERTKTSTGTDTRQGYGTTSLRLKQNLWGNDGGPSALALLPSISFPTAQDDLGSDEIEYGLAVPFSLELSDQLSLGLMTEFNRVTDEDGDGQHAESIFTIVVGTDFTETFGGFVEFFSQIDWEEPRDWVGTLDLGITYALTENIQLDAGVYIGLTESADDLNPFIGLSIRL